MILHTIWGYDGFDDVWTFADAWTEHNVDDNADGYREAIVKAKQDFAPGDVRVVDVQIPMAAIRKALKNPTIDAGKVEAGNAPE